jgi:polysaccharide chain length determinant protein (PEP-CTERM system associated)
MNIEQGIQVLDIFGLARRRGKLIAIVAGAIVFVTFWVSMALPNLYTSSAMILVEPQSVDEELVDSGVRQSNLNERLGLMTAEILSRGRLSEIITEMGLYEDESRRMERSEVVDRMRSFVSVEPVLSELDDGNPRKDVQFTTFKIVFRHEDNRVAAAVAQKIANDFINANIESRTSITGKSLDFMGDEIDGLARELAVVEKAIAEVKLVSAGRLPAEFDANQRMLQFGMGDLREAQRVLASAEADASFWKNQGLAASTVGSAGDTSSPSHRLKLLDFELGSMLARGFTNRHPDVVRVEAEMGLLREQVSDSAERKDQPKSIAEQNAQAQEGRALQRAVSAQEDIDRIRVTIADLEVRLGETPGVAERLDALNRQYEHLYRSYQDFSNRLQKASVQADLERRQLGEKFRILESAEPAREPSSPNRFLLLSLGTIFGLALGAGAGMIIETTDSSMHTANDLQTALGIPVLVSVPKIMLEADRAARSRRILRESLAAILVAVFVLVGGLATYVFVNGSGRTGGGDAEASQPTDSTTEVRSNLGMSLG